MNTVTIRPRATLTAFQWNGERVEGWPLMVVESAVETLQIRAVHYDGTESYGMPGDWVVTGLDGSSWVWPNATFHENYEIVGE